MRPVLALSVLATLASVLVAQDTPVATFEVASIKVNKSGESRTRFGLPPNRFTATNASLRDIIRFAYEIGDVQIVSLPAWAISERFDIEARIDPAGQAPMVLGPGGPPPRLFGLLRSLLAERFRLVSHAETREMPIYALVPARRDRPRAAGLVPSTIDCAALAATALANPNAPPTPPRPGQPPKCGMFGVPGRLEGWSATLDELAHMLTPMVDRLVVDRTGLAGGFEFTVSFTPQQGPAGPVSSTAAQQPDQPDPPLTTALEEQLGLKFESTRAPVQVLVIDAVSRPTPD